MELSLLPGQQAILNSPARLRLATGGWGGGKTYCGSVYALNQASDYPSALGLIAANTYSQLAKSTLKPFCDLMDSLQIRWAYGTRPKWKALHAFVDYANILSIANGASILCFSGEREEAVLGVTAGWAWLDEVQDMALGFWNNVQSRLRDPSGSGKTFVTTSVPLSGPQHWLHDKFIDPSKRLKDSSTVTLKTVDNVHNAQGYYEGLLADLGSSLAAVLLEGEWVDLAQGRAFEFSRDRNVKECRCQEGMALILSCDQNVEPYCGLVMQVDRRNRRAWVLDEIVLANNGSTRKAAIEFSRRYATWKGDVWYWCDMSSAKRDTREGNSDFSIMEETLRPFFPSARCGHDMRQRLVMDGVWAVNGMLSPAIGEPRLLMDPKCKDLIRDMESLRWEAGTRKLDKDSNPKLSHLADALRYVIAQEFPVMNSRGMTHIELPERPSKFL